MSVLLLALTEHLSARARGEPLHTVLQSSLQAVIASLALPNHATMSSPTKPSDVTPSSFTTAVTAFQRIISVEAQTGLPFIISSLFTSIVLTVMTAFRRVPVVEVQPLVRF